MLDRLCESCGGFPMHEFWFGILLIVLGLCLSFIVAGCSGKFSTEYLIDSEGEFQDIVCWDSQGRLVLSADRHTMSLDVERDIEVLSAAEYWILDVRGLETGMCGRTAYDLEIMGPVSDARGILTVAPNGEFALSFVSVSATLASDQIICDLEVRCPDESRRLSNFISLRPSAERMKAESEAFRNEILDNLRGLSKRKSPEVYSMDVSIILDFSSWLKNAYQNRKPFLDSETRFRTVRLLRLYFDSKSISQDGLSSLCATDQHSLVDTGDGDLNYDVPMESAALILLAYLCE